MYYLQTYVKGTSEGYEAFEFSNKRELKKLIREILPSPGVIDIFLTKLILDSFDHVLEDGHSCLILPKQVRIVMSEEPLGPFLPEWVPDIGDDSWLTNIEGLS